MKNLFKSRSTYNSETPTKDIYADDEDSSDGEEKVGNEKELNVEEIVIFIKPIKWLTKHYDDFQLKIKSNMTILDLKSEIHKSEGIIPIKQVLLFDEKMLKDDEKLSKYDIKNDSVIELEVPTS